MAKEGPDRIMQILNDYSEDDIALSKFLESIFQKEMDIIHFWTKDYEKNLDKYCKIWEGYDED